MKVKAKTSKTSAAVVMHKVAIVAAKKKQALHPKTVDVKITSAAVISKAAAVNPHTTALQVFGNYAVSGPGPILLEDADGMFTLAGMQVARAYANRWLHDGLRDLEMERKFPSFGAFFYDLRADVELAKRYADEWPAASKGMDKSLNAFLDQMGPPPVYVTPAQLKLLKGKGGFSMGATVNKRKTGQAEVDAALTVFKAIHQPGKMTELLQNKSVLIVPKP